MVPIKFCSMISTEYLLAIKNMPGNIFGFAALITSEYLLANQSQGQSQISGCCLASLFD
jgi:hypothetical protein